MDNSECCGVKFVKIYREMTSQEFFEKSMVLIDYIGMFYIRQYNWIHTVHEMMRCIYH